MLIIFFIHLSWVRYANGGRDIHTNAEGDLLTVCAYDRTETELSESEKEGERRARAE